MAVVCNSDDSCFQAGANKSPPLSRGLTPHAKGFHAEESSVGVEIAKTPTYSPTPENRTPVTGSKRMESASDPNPQLVGMPLSALSGQRISKLKQVP